MKKAIIFVSILVLLTLTTVPFGALAADISVADLFRFIPTEIIIEDNEYTVSGYFINLSSSDVYSIRDMSMIIYRNGEALTYEGHFNGTNLSSIIVEAGTCEDFSFTYSDLGTGREDSDTIVDSNVYAIFDCTFTSRS